MYCNKCGAKFNDTSQRFCEKCGSDVFKDGYSNTPIPLKTAAPNADMHGINVSGENYSQQMNTQVPPVAQRTNYSQQMNTQTAYPGVYNNQPGVYNNQQGAYNNQYAQGNMQAGYAAPVQPNLPMKWHKFLVNFSLIFSAVIYVGLAILTATGLHYFGDADLVYSEMPEMRIVDIVYGLALLVVAVFEVYSWSRLRKFRKNAPAVLIMTFALNNIVSIVYSAIAAVVVGGYAGAEFATDLWGEVGSGITMGIFYCLFNYIYYKKRKHLFVN